MKKNLLFFVLLLSIIVSACQTQCPPLTDSQKADIEKQIREVVDKIITTAENLDVAGYSAFINSDEFIATINKGYAFQSKKEWIDSVGVWWSGRKSQDLDQVKVKIAVLSADYALADRVSVWQITNKNDFIWSFNQACSYIFKKEASGWKFIHYHESSQVIQ